MSEVLLSAGIDIGTSTTQLVFSRLKIENLASAYSVPRMEIVDKEIIYRSDIHMTPLLNNDVIDGIGVRNIIEAEYEKAGIDKQDIDTGAVIITGETANKKNAKEILMQCSDFSGDFVVATAGPDLESIISGKGAGADVFSKENHTSIVHLDIGGGTSNLSVFKNGISKDCGCLDIGGRILKVNDNNEITYISEKLKELIHRHHLEIKEGVRIEKEKISNLIGLLVQILEMSVGMREKNEDYDLMLTNHGLKNAVKTEWISFSGGVAEYIYEAEQNDLDSMNENDFKFGDIGVCLGKAIRKSNLFNTKKVFESNEKIRATVVGAGAHTTKLSGSTVLMQTDVLPVKNIPVIKIEPHEEFTDSDFGLKVQRIFRGNFVTRFETSTDQKTDDSKINKAAIIKAIRDKWKWYDTPDAMKNENTDNGSDTMKNENTDYLAQIHRTLVALAFTGLKSPSFTQIQIYAQAIYESLYDSDKTESGSPVIVITEMDMGKVLGQALRTVFGVQKQIICLDSIALSQGDYIDIGRPTAGGMIVPVVVKTLVFSGKK